MIFLIDMDGVIADFEQGFLYEWWNKYPGRFYIPAVERITFYLEDQYPENCHEDIEKVISSERFFADLPPIEGGIAALNRLVAEGHEVRICTAPYHKAMHNCVNGKVEWVERYLGTEWLKCTIVSRDKTLVRGDVLVDDKPNITGAMDRPWKHILFKDTRNSDDTQAWHWMHGWDELDDLLEKLESDLWTQGLV